MAELTHPLRRALMATLAATGMAAIAVTTVACAPVSSGTDSSDDASASSDAAADSDSSSPSTTESADSSDSNTASDAADATGSDAGASVGTLPSNKVLPKAMSGQEAIDALGDKIDVVAKRVGKTPEELKELLLRDKSARVTPEGNIRYHD